MEQPSRPGKPASPMATPAICPIPEGLAAPGSAVAPFERAIELAELPPGSMRRVTFADLDLLIAHTPNGLVATEDRCPHMAAPLSLGPLDGCVVDCVLHKARFDLSTGATVRFPTTGGLGADGEYHPGWTPQGAQPKSEVADAKALARALTRIRRLRFYSLRVSDGWIEVGVPTG